MICKICENRVNKIFSALVLRKYTVNYYQCTKCRFIQTDDPYWLNEAYADAISEMDTGYVIRNIDMSSITERIISFCYSSDKKFLDFGGGYGLFVRMMRDKGFDFYLKDEYCQNIFANNFKVDTFDGTTNHFELVTAFEVFEHLEQPLDEILKMLKISDSILFSTALQPKKQLVDCSDWWYFVPESGQHISFYSLESLTFIANKLNLKLYTNRVNLHLLTKKRFFINPVLLISYNYYFFKILKRFLKRRKSLANKDSGILIHN